MLKNNFLTLILLFTAHLAFAQVTVSGTVHFAIEDNQPVPGWQVDFFMGPDAFMGTAFTDDEGFYEIIVDATFGGSPPWYARVFDICTGNAILVEWEPDPDVTEYVANFILCEGINPPPPPDGCEAFFFFEQLEQTEEGYPVTFFDLSFFSENVIAWQWDFGDGNTSTEPNPIHHYAEQGEYLVTLLLTSTDGEELCTSMYESIVVVYDENECNCPTDEYDPVCVYSPSGEIFEFTNSCYAECAGYSPGQYQECDQGCVCPEFYSPVCVTTADGETITFDNYCFAECEGYGPDQWYECNPNGCECPDIYDPVCVVIEPGFEITFNNACEAECEGFAPGDYQECGSECGCPDFYEPVCVVLDNGEVVTFSNFCFAQCEGYGPEQWIECENTCDCPEDLYDPVCVATPSGQILTFINPCEAECAGFDSEIYYSCDGGVCECPEYWDPVCVIGEDGEIITFSNPCFAECENYGPDQYFECDPDGCDCPDVYDPVCAMNDIWQVVTFSNTCEALCVGYSLDDLFECEEDCVCPDIWDPVCVAGPDGVVHTYGNACEAACEGFTEADFVECEEECDCSDFFGPPVCVSITGNPSDVIEFSNACYAECAGYSPEDFVDCEDDCGCSTVWEPVCAMNDIWQVVTFSNTCEALCVGYSLEDLFECEEDCVCPDIWDPVCVIGSDGVVYTYGNACEAACEGYSEQDFVECEIDCNCPAIWDPVCVATDTGFVISFANSCEAECAGFGPEDYFECDVECECDDENWDPVCVNGFAGQITFPNACVAMCEGFTEVDFVECDMECECDDYYLPVCVIDPITGDWLEFLNPCFAACEGYSSGDIVPCSPIDDCWAEFNFDIVSEDGLTVQFNDLSYTSDEITSWYWNFGDGETSTEQNPIHTYAEGGVYDISLVITSEVCGEVGTVYHICLGDGGVVGGPDCQSFFFFEQPDAENLLLFQFIDLSLSDVNAWVWNFGDGNTSTEQNPVHVYESAGDYVVSLTVFADECQSTVNMPITAGDNIWYGELDCRAWFLPVNNPDNNEVFFVNLSSADAIEFTWDFGDGEISNDPLALHEYAEAGTYTVTLTIVTASGCTNSFSTTVDLGTDGFTSDPVFSIVSATDEIDQLTALIAAPNPTNALVRISWDTQEAGDYTWQLFSVDGRLVEQGKARSITGMTNVELDLNDKASGVYLFRLQTPDGIQTLRLSKF